MLTKILNGNEQTLLSEKLVTAFMTTADLRTWLQAHYMEALQWLTDAPLQNELTVLMTSAQASDGMEGLLQRLADHPPNGDVGLAAIIFALTGGEIKAKPKTRDGLPPVPAHQSWFAADRPFVNRKELRRHLEDLATSPPGAKCILVIEGEERSGKSFAVALVRGCQQPANLLPTIDLEKFARYGAQVNSRELAVLIVGDADDCPVYDPTKDDEAVPRLLHWMSTRLMTRNLWIIIDHWNRKPLTQGAISLLKEFASFLRDGVLPNVRLILADFNRADLPMEWRDDVRHDRAVLPTSTTVREWCLQLATAARRQHTVELADQWTGDVFSCLEEHKREDGTWHRELERRLRHAFDRILACEEQS